MFKTLVVILLLVVINKLEEIRQSNDKNFSELCKLVDILQRIDNKSTLHK